MNGHNANDDGTKWASLAAGWVNLIDRYWPRFVFGIFVFTVCIVAADVVTASGFREINWIYLTAYPPAFYVLVRSTELPHRIRAVRHSLIRQGILEVCESSPTGELISIPHDRVFLELEGEIEDEIFKRTALMTAVCGGVGTLMVVAFGIHLPLDGWFSWGTYLLGLAYVVLLCMRFGRALGFSLAMWTYRSIVVKKGHKRYRIHPRPQAGHVDGHCGFKIVNEFWSYEAGLMIPLLLYTLGWLAILGAGGATLVIPEFDEIYRGHQPLRVFLWLSAFLVVLQILTLWLPVFALRVIMGRAREEARVDADAVAMNVTNLKRRLLDENTSPNEKEEIAKELTFALDAYRDHENMPLWPISGRTLGTHLMHLWSLVAFLGIVTTEDIQSKSIDWLVAGTPVRVAFVNDSSVPLTLSYLGPERCWYQGTIPEKLKLEAGETSEPYKSEALSHRCKGELAPPFFSVWIDKKSKPIGPISIGTRVDENCGDSDGAPCLSAITKLSGIRATITKDADDGVWTVRLFE